MSNEQKVSSELVQVYVGNIKYETTEKELYDLAKKYVDVESTKIPTKLGRSQGFGFVTVYNEESLEKLKKELDGTTFQGRTIYIKNAVHGQNKKEEKDEYVRRMPPPQPMMAPMREYNYPDPVYRDERDYFYNDYYYDNIPRERRRGIPPPPPPPPAQSSTPHIPSQSPSNTTSSPKPKPVPAPASESHLDLIKSGKFVLKAVDKTKRAPEVKPKFEEIDPNTLTVQEILQHAATIRDAVACSDSSESEESNDSSTTW